MLRLDVLALGLFTSWVAAAGGQSSRIGWIYRIEGTLRGHPVEYVGSAADLKQRLNGNHQWTELLRQPSTRVYAKEVVAELNISASNRKTLLSARNEALRAAEQRALDEVRGRIEEVNRSRAPAQKQAKILNEINASTEAAEWEARHQVRTSREWRAFEGLASGAIPKALTLLTILDAYAMYHEAKMSRYVMAPYVLEDERGVFSLWHEKSSWFARHHYYKVYVSERVKGQRLEVSSWEFEELSAEAEALWGTTDWRGDFVPGILNRELPRATKSGVGNQVMQ